MSGFPPSTDPWNKDKKLAGAYRKWLAYEKRMSKAYIEWRKDKPKMRDPEFKRAVVDYVLENRVSTEAAYEAVLALFQTKE
jgi:uncharacterized protein (DUF2235 family)